MIVFGIYLQIGYIKTEKQIIKDIRVTIYFDWQHI